MKIFLILLFLTIPSMAHAASPEGFWLTENKRSVIKVEPCADKLCGKIVWIIKGGMQFDAKNPQESLRGQPMCGLKIISGMKKNSAKKWSGGYIYKADDGDVYTANITMGDSNTLKVRGYVGVPVLGKSQTWTRVSSKDYPSCSKP